MTDIAHLPPEPPKPDTVPLREQHLKGVLDPLSAIMVLSRGSSANPCDRRMPIFDGKERFDLVFSYKGECKVVEQQPSGQPGVAHVCRVQLPADRRPQGRQRDRATWPPTTPSRWRCARSRAPTCSSPIRSRIPTMAGSATIVSKRVEIVSPGKPQIALLH